MITDLSSSHHSNPEITHTNVMAHFKVLIASILVLSLATNAISKIVLPHKLRYLENMLNSEVVAKAAKIRQRLEANPNSLPDTVDTKMWPLLLAKYGQEENQTPPPTMYDRRAPNFKFLPSKLN